MPQRITIEVFRAFAKGKLRQIGLSAEQVRRLCPQSENPGWTLERSVESVPEAEGIVDWTKHGGCGGEHVHWQCPHCGAEHISDFDPHADSNPALWFCERSHAGEMCLVYWRHEEDDQIQR